MMAKICFLQDNIINESLGVMCLSSYLKAKGHKVELCLLSEHKTLDSVLGEIRGFDPDILGFSVMTAQADAYEAIAEALKKKLNCPIIWGGAHPTFMPNIVAEIDAIDIVCIGEGEEALLTLMDRIDASDDYTSIPGLWIKNNMRWIKNEVGYLEQKLDKYPFPDRELLYKKSPLLQHFGLKRFLTMRGCPFDCNYCFEPAMKVLYRDKGKLVRRHSVEYVIGEIQDVIQKFPGARTIHFSDDSFNLDHEWITKFLPEYKERINLPFTCNLVVQLTNEQLITRLREAGCRGVIIGLESGVERIRQDILNKHVKNEQYIELSRLLRKNDIMLITNNMFRLPTETLNDAIETIRFNRVLGIHGIRAGIVKIYKGTKLAEFALQNNLCESEGKYTFKAKDVNNEHRDLDNLLWLAYYLVKIPLLIRFAKKLVRTRVSRLFKFLIIFTYWPDITFFQIPLWQAWKYFRASSTIFMKGMGKDQRGV
jgi:radical SAM superfamily enzyme YgiQ (UPF0313 family)